MRKKLGWIAMLLAMCVMNGWACTNLIVGKKASADGSVIVSYSADSYGMFGFLCHYPAMTHESGAMRPERISGDDRGDHLWRTSRTGGYYRNHGLWKPDLCGAPALSHSKGSH